jgi:uncharacterized membrane protein YccC
MPHMDTIASLVVVVACASAIAGWVADGSEMISYAGLQIAFAFFLQVFQGLCADTDLDNVRNRVVGILFGLIVTGLVFRYIWPSARSTDCGTRCDRRFINLRGCSKFPTRKFDRNGENRKRTSDSETSRVLSRRAVTAEANRVRA